MLFIFEYIFISTLKEIQNYKFIFLLNVNTQNVKKITWKSYIVNKMVIIRIYMFFFLFIINYCL